MEPMTFPVRFSCAGETVQTTSRALGEGSVFVRCVEPPEAGEKAMLTLYLPAGELEVPAVVGESLPEGSEPGFRADFGDLGPQAFDRISATLKGDLSVTMDGFKLPEPAPVKTKGRARRLFPRVAERLRVKLGARSGEPGVVALNANANGLFVLLEAPPEPGAELEMDLELPDGGPPAHVRGRVVRRVLAAEAKERGIAPGAALVFVEADDGFRARYDAFLAKHK